MTKQDKITNFANRKILCNIIKQVGKKSGPSSPFTTSYHILEDHEFIYCANLKPCTYKECSHSFLLKCISIRPKLQDA